MFLKYRYSLINLMHSYVWRRCVWRKAEGENGVLRLSSQNTRWKKVAECRMVEGYRERSIALLSFIIKSLQRHTQCLLSFTTNKLLHLFPLFLLLSNIIFASSFTATQLSMHIITCTSLLPQTNPSYSPSFFFLPFTPTKDEDEWDYL